MPLDSVTLQAVSDGRVGQNMAVVVLTLAIYDFFAILDDEVRLVWPSRISVSRLTYHINRLWNIVVPIQLVYIMLGATNDTICLKGYLSISLMIIIQLIISVVILSIRTYALWGFDRLVGFTLVLTILLGVAPSLYLDVMFTSNVSVSPVRFSPNGCYIQANNDVLWISFAIAMALHTVILSLVLIRISRMYGYGLQPLVRGILQDGLFYYVLVEVMLLLNLIVITTARPTIRSAFVPLHGTLEGIVCSRILLRLRKIDESTRTDSRSIDPPVFNRPSTTFGSH